MRTTIGASLVVLLLLLAPASGAGGKDPEPAVIAGTVFRDPGFAFPRAEVHLSVKSAPQGVKAPKPRKLLSDARGEFAFHVPPLKSEYVITVRAKGFAQEEKVATLSGGPERLDLYFNLKPVQ